MTQREKIEAIFAKARSTTSPHERDNAVTLGTRLAEKAGLDLDLFDIPGRVRRTPPRPIMGEWHLALTVAEIEEILAQFASRMSAAPAHAFRPPRYCPHGSDMALFGDSCVLCERDRHQ